MNAEGSTLADWLVRLESFSPSEIELGLERVDELLARMQIVLPGTVLHVAGTNGKGSSVAIAARILEESGRSVGCYTSPHISVFNERIVVDGNMVSDAEIVDAFERVADARRDTPLTYFEYATLAALSVFETRNVEIASLEVGLGGRLDAVNAVEPDAGLITNVSLDHQDWLGDDLESIAREKAGIMRADKPIVFASRDVPAAIVESADATGADLLLAGRDFDWHLSGEQWEWSGRTKTLRNLVRPALHGDFQVGNAAGVLALLEAAGFGRLLDEASVNDALTRVQLAGRLQEIRRRGNWLVDVAHNPAAAAELATYLSANPVPGETRAVIGMLSNKDADALVAQLAGVVDQWTAVTADHPRALPADALAGIVTTRTGKPCETAGTVDDAMRRAAALSDEDGRTVISGSFYVVGPALEWLGIYSAGLGES